MELEFLDYSTNPNPYEPIWALPHTMSSSGPHFTLFHLWIGLLSVIELSKPYVPYLSASTPPIASRRLDFPPLSPTTLNLLAACIAPSPNFDSILPEASLHLVLFGIPISLGLS